jgi:hypothetical protein
MKKGMLILAVLLPLYWACNNEEETATEKGENDVDAARMFIRSALDGRWKDARRLVVQDSSNIQDLEVAEQIYTKRMNVTEQRGYREAQLRIHDTREVNDSVTIVTYSNTYKNKRDSVKVVRVGGQWLVDLKYSFPANNPPHQ